MREFTDEKGRVWVATVRKRPGTDYKGRFQFVAYPKDSGEEDTVGLVDVTWNSERTAARTLATMSLVELRRRLRSARGRAGAALS